MSQPNLIRTRSNTSISAYTTCVVNRFFQLSCSLLETSVPMDVGYVEHQLKLNGDNTIQYCANSMDLHSSAIIVGKNGSGKTTLLQRFAFRYAQEFISRSSATEDLSDLLIPLYLNLSDDVNNRNSTAPLEDIVEKLVNQHYSEHATTLMDLIKCGSSSRIVLLLDFDIECRIPLSQLLSLGLTTIIAVPDFHFEALVIPDILKLRVFRIEDMNKEEQLKIATHLLGSLHKPLVNQVSKIIDIQSLRTPKMISFLVATLLRDKQADVTKTSLLMKGVEITSRYDLFSKMSKYLVDRAINLSGLDCRRQDVIRYLETFCFILKYRNGQICTNLHLTEQMLLVEDLIKLRNLKVDFSSLQPYMNRMLLEGKLPFFIRVTRNDHGIDVFKFIDPAFCNYLAGQYIANDINARVKERSRTFKWLRNYNKSFELLPKRNELSLLEDLWFRECIVFASPRLTTGAFNALSNYVLQPDFNKGKRGEVLIKTLFEERDLENRKQLNIAKRVHKSLANLISTDALGYIRNHPSSLVFKLMKEITGCDAYQIGVGEMGQKKAWRSTIYCLDDVKWSKFLDESMSFFVPQTVEMLNIASQIQKAGCPPNLILKILENLSEVPGSSAMVLEVVQTFHSISMERVVSCAKNYADSDVAEQILSHIMKIRMSVPQCLQLAKYYREKMVDHVETIIGLLIHEREHLRFDEYYLDDFCELYSFENILGYHPHIDEQVYFFLSQLDIYKQLAYIPAMRLVIDPNLRAQYETQCLNCITDEQDYLVIISSTLPYCPLMDLHNIQFYHTEEKLPAIAFPAFNVVYDPYSSQISINVTNKSIFRDVNHTKLFGLYCPHKIINYWRKYEAKSECLDVLEQLCAVGVTDFHLLTLLVDDDMVDKERLAALFWKSIQIRVTEPLFDNFKFHSLVMLIHSVALSCGVELFYTCPDANLKVLDTLFRNIFQTITSNRDAQTLLTYLIEMFEKGHAPWLLDTIVGYLQGIRDIHQRTEIIMNGLSLKDMIAQGPPKSDQCPNYYCFWEALTLSAWIERESFRS